MTVMDRWTVDDLLRRRPTGGAVRDAHPRGARGRARRCSPAPIPSDEFAELKPRIVWDRVTDVVEGRRDARVVAVTSRRHDPGSRPVRRVHGRRGGDARPARRRARRGDGLRAASRDARRRDRAGGEQRGGSRRSATTGSRSAPAPGVPGKLPFWQGDAVGPAGRARPGARRVRARDGGRSRRGAREAGARRLDAARRDARPRRARRREPASPTSRTSARRPAPCRPTGGSSSSGSATSSATGGCAS